MAKKNFESKLLKLEEIVQEMESGEMTLDESIKSFESGIELYKDCRTFLQQAEKKIQVLNESLEEEEYSEE